MSKQSIRRIAIHLVHPRNVASFVTSLAQDGLILALREALHALVVASH